MRKCFYELNESIKKFWIKAYIAIKSNMPGRLKKPLENDDGMAKDEIIGLAIVLVIAAFVVAPGLRDFAEDVVDGIQTWYDNSIKSKIFGTN